MSSGHSSRDKDVNRRLTSLQVVGGYDCNPSMPRAHPDVDVFGGLRVRKTACIRNLCANKTKTMMVDEKNEDQGLVLTNPIMMDQYGIARVFLDFPFFFEDNDGTILFEDEWITRFESHGAHNTPLTKQDGSLFRIPTLEEYNHPCLTGDLCVLVEIHATFDLSTIEFDEPLLFEEEVFRFVVIKNYEEESEDPNDNQELTQIILSGSEIGFERKHTEHLHDILVCKPGDRLDIRYDQNTLDGEAKIHPGPYATYVTFKILGFQPELEIGEPEFGD